MPDVCFTLWFPSRPESLSRFTCSWWWHQERYQERLCLDCRSNRYVKRKSKSKGSSSSISSKIIVNKKRRVPLEFFLRLFFFLSSFSSSALLQLFFSSSSALLPTLPSNSSFKLFPQLVLSTVLSLHRFLTFQSASFVCVNCKVSFTRSSWSLCASHDSCFRHTHKNMCFDTKAERNSSDFIPH